MIAFDRRADDRYARHQTHSLGSDRAGKTQLSRRPLVMSMPSAPYNCIGLSLLAPRMGGMEAPRYPWLRWMSEPFASSPRRWGIVAVLIVVILSLGLSGKLP